MAKITKAEPGQIDTEYDDTTRTHTVKVESIDVLEVTRSGMTINGDLTVTGEVNGTIGASDLELTGETRGDIIRRGASNWERIAAATSGRILVGDGTDIASVAVSDDATLAANGALTVTDVTVGSDAAGDIQYKSSATALARLAKGTAGQVLRMNAGATAPSWSDDLESVVVEDFAALDTTDQVAIVLPSGLAADGATGVMNHLYSPGGKVYCIASLGAGQTAFPSIVANGLDIGGDQVADEGWEIWSHFAGATGKPFIVGKSPAFYFTCTIEVADADGIDHLMVGFRRAGPHLATMGDIQDYASFGVSTAADPMAIKLLTGLNGTDTNTDTTQTAAEATAIQFKVLVSAAGIVTFQHDIAVPGTLAAPSATVALTLDNGDPVIPFVRFLHDTGVGSPTIRKWDAGLQ